MSSRWADARPPRPRIGPSLARDTVAPPRGRRAERAPPRDSATRDVLRTQLRRLRVAAVRVFEPAHPRQGDPLVVPGDRVLRVEPDRFVVAFDRLRELIFPEVHSPQVAPRDLVRCVQPDRVLVTP